MWRLMSFSEPPATNPSTPFTSYEILIAACHNGPPPLGTIRILSVYHPRLGVNVKGIYPSTILQGMSSGPGAQTETLPERDVHCLQHG